MAGKRGRSGRKTAFTPALGRKVVRAVRDGALLHEAAAFAGIHRTTLLEWLKRGEQAQDPHDPLFIFSDAFSLGRTSGKMRAIRAVHGAMKKNWRAAAWWLGVTDPKHYGPKVRVTLEEEFSSALRRVAKRLPEDVYEQVLDAMLEDGSEDGEGPAPEEEEPLE